MNERAVFIAAGALVGLLVIGISSHLAMAGISYIIHGVNHLSVRGIVQSAIIGLIIGMLGGYIRFLIFRKQTMACWKQSLCLGGILFVLSLAFAMVAVPGVLPIRPTQLITFVVVFFIYWLYAFLLEIAVNRGVGSSS